MSRCPEIHFEAASEADFPRTTRVVRTAAEEGTTPGAVAGVWSIHTPDRAWTWHSGQRRTHPTSLPMTVDTIFDLASVTKVIGTVPLVATLIERGWIRWDQPVCDFFAGFRFPEIRIHHLLAHTAGYPAWLPFWKELQQQFGAESFHRVRIRERQAAMRKLVMAVKPEHRPGEVAVYSDLSFLILGFCLEEITGLPLDQAVERWVWRAMGLTGLHFRPVLGRRAFGVDESCAATERSVWKDGVYLQGQVHDENAWAMGGYGGHAGAFGTVADVLRYGAGLLSGYFSAETLRAQWTRVDQPSGCTRTLGWDTPSGERSSVGRYFSPHSVGHLGFTGTSLWIDPDAGVVAALLTNRVHLGRENNQIREFRPAFHDALCEDLRALTER